MGQVEGGEVWWWSTGLGARDPSLGSVTSLTKSVDLCGPQFPYLCCRKMEQERICESLGRTPPSEGPLLCAGKNSRANHSEENVDFFQAEIYSIDRMWSVSGGWVAPGQGVIWESKSDRRYTFHRQNTGHLKRREAPRCVWGVLFYGLNNFIC